jgi:hypothetical protein
LTEAEIKSMPERDKPLAGSSRKKRDLQNCPEHPLQSGEGMTCSALDATEASSEQDPSVGRSEAERVKEA